MHTLLPDYPELDARLAAAMGASQWYVALSGGMDSTVLLALLRDWRRVHPEAPPLAAIHINHGLQEAADAWQRHCAALCRQLEVPLHCDSVAVRPSGGGIESAARAARYQAFEQRLQSGELLFMGHHLDDQIETFFLRLLRGAGVRGLAAMPATRALGRGLLLRPLLTIPREELVRLAQRLGLPWVEDPSNADTGPDRNFLRQQLLPLLAGRWPGYRQTVSRAATHLAAATAMAAGDGSVAETHFSVMGDPGIPLSGLPLSQPDRVMTAVRGWLLERGLPMPAMAPLQEFARQLQAGGTGRPRMEWGGHALQRYREAIYLLPSAFVSPEDGPRLAPGESLQVPGLGRFELLPAAGGGIELVPGESLQLRWRQGGERCQPRGRGASQSLKKLLQEAAVPPWWRQRLPLFYLGEELQAVADLWQCVSRRLPGVAAADVNCWTLRWERNITPDPAPLPAAFD